jgi:predicted nucleotidyltransferase
MVDRIADDPVALALFPAARREILRLVYGHPGESFYLREIAARTGLAVGHIQREAARLSKAGILRRSRRGRHVYFTANDECPVYAELRSLTTKTMGAAARLREALQPLAGRIDVAFVFGSMARQDERAESDVDLFVIGNVTFADVTKVASRAEREMRREISASVFRADDFRGKLSEGSHFLRSVMRSPKLFVLGDADDLATLQGELVDT